MSLILLSICFTGLAQADQPPALGVPTGARAPAEPVPALETLGAANAVAGALLADDYGALGPLVDGCCIWEQPGVALVITNRWQADGPVPELWLDDARLAQFLLAERHLSQEKPLFAPLEPEEGADGLSLIPTVFILDSELARERLTHHIDNLVTWMELNEDAAFLLPQPDDVAVDCAVVFIDSAGPLEFYFQQTDDGLKLKHLVHYYWFSA